MVIRIYLQMLKRSWWIVVVSSLIAFSFVLVAAFVTTPIYRSTARLLVSPNLNSTLTGTDFLRSFEVLDNRSIVATYAEILNSLRIFEDTVVVMDLRRDVTSEYIHSAMALPEANIIVLSVEGPDPQITTSLANTMGNQAIDFIHQLYTAYEISFLDNADIPTSPIRPNTIRDGSIALVLGLVFGVMLAISREQMRIPVDKLLQRAVVDKVSMAYKRSYVINYLNDAVARTDQAMFSFGLIRLDGLREYMKVLPQPILQNLLRDITHGIRNDLKGTDIVGRWDVSTYSVVLPETPGTAAVAVLGRVQIFLSKPMRFSPDGETLNLYPKIGLVERLPGESAGKVIDNARTALGQAHHGERGLVLYKIHPLAGF